MIKFIRHFLQSASGVVTIDWVVLTAAVVGIGIAAVLSTIDSTTQMGDDIGTFMETDPRLIQNRE